MFYPADSLKRGGRFYLCWVADSWPLRFATITHRQLWSQDIRKICDDLLEVMRNESGRPTQRFSLRLSAQLLRGLVRLYQRKVNVFLGDLCMINANVFKNTNKKWNILEVDLTEHVRRPLPQLNLREVIQEPPEDERRIEEMIQASGNVVANIQDITLREPVEQGTDMHLKPNDGFGEEENSLLQLQDRTMEQILVQTNLSRAASDGFAPHDTGDMSRDKSRLGPSVLVEHSLISDHDHTSIFKNEKSVLEFDKDIPEIPEILPPELSIPQPQKTQAVDIEPQIEEPRYIAVEQPKEAEPSEIELEELEDIPPTKRRRVRNKLIIDKKIKINQHHFRARIENPLVELRCQDSYDDIISIRVLPEVYFHRPCQGGARIVSNLGFELKRLFGRNLGVTSTKPLAERELEAVMQRAGRTPVERVVEEPTEKTVPEGPPIQIEPPIAEVIVPGEGLNVSEAPRVSVPELTELDIADMLTQKVETLSQARKRKSAEEAVTNAKKQRSFGYVSFRENQQAKEQSSQEIGDREVNKENRDANLPPLETRDMEHVPVSTERIVSSLLQEAGLADIQVAPLISESEVRTSQRVMSRGKSGRGTHSETSETPLGSLDRTKVSLGDSDQTTDSMRFIRDQWGTEGTMLKILKVLKNGAHPVTINNLLAKGPLIPGHKHIIAARCFTSILKLKQYGFINVCKDPDSLEIKDITLGPKLTSSQEQF